MERHQAQLVLDHLDIIEHFAKGGQLEFHGKTCSGHETVWPVTKGILVNCLPKYRKIDKFIDYSIPKKYCSRWCKNKTKGDIMINAKEARANLLIRQQIKQNELNALLWDPLVGIVEEAISNAMESSIAITIEAKYAPIVGSLCDEMANLGYVVETTNSRDPKVSVILTVDF